MKAKVELTAESVKVVIAEKKPTSLTQLAHFLGYKGSVSSGLVKKLRQLVPEIDALLKSTMPAEPAKGVTEGKSGAAKPKAKAMPSKAAKGKATPASKSTTKAGKYPRDPKNPFREGSYATCYDILAKHGQGLPRERLIALLAEATGKDLKRASFDAQVVLSARGSDEPGLSRNEGPRNRSCRPGFWVKRENGHVQLMID